MNPFYFGSSAMPLFGVHHPPSGSDIGRGVVLCYPMGSEYLRSHRAFRQLSNLLVRAGVHVLRFDYLGTGDSWGDSNAASVTQWIDDIDAATLELKESSGLERVSLAGLRLGATLAATAGFVREDIDRVVLWDPILAGDRWLDGLFSAEGRGGSEHDTERVPAYPQGTVGLGGFPLTPRLADGIRGLALTALAPEGGVSVDILVSREDDAARTLAEGWNAADRSAGENASYRCIRSEGDWAVGDRFGSALIPQAIIQGVVRCLTQG